ncbi:hemoglobin/transferrin/lactoferrin receptor protein [Roseomonas rosea]|uniref:Hemoglobin/transferrin/lactoferrin receptor protein n=1 Tax=Muricoccus roseus TaxID=198092 RepID=A0A1M6D3J1_9PROT|nr:TonB-dependent hemoglobin/transferrin/lactoferrin family receptor [Roseomonas rosea]SHI67806.1 hemoglobin/transferrin/lactoferrin receptor protein [Roseomonas rosea]
MLPRRAPAALTAFVLLPGAALAQAAVTPAADPVAVPPVTVTATREERSVDDVPATVTVIDTQQIDRQNANSPREALRYEPGVSFGNQPARNGGTNFYIRGIGGNRVRVQVDGVRIPDFPESNSGAGNYTRDFVDLESVKRIEILRGPASALYGSDALGGVVSYITRDPSDYIEEGRNLGFNLRFGYSGADQSFSRTITGAARAGDVEALAQFTNRTGSEVRPNGNVLPNPQDYTVNNFLGTGIWHLTPADHLRVTGELFERQVDTTLNSELSNAAGAAVLSSFGEDYSRRARISAQYTHDAPFLFADRIDLRGWVVSLDRRERTEQYRSTTTAAAGANRLRYSDFRFQQDIYGGEVQLRSDFTAFGLPNSVIYGATLERIETARPRNRFEQNLQTGAVTNAIAGETYPNKNFPDTETTQFGAYVQDEITIGRLSITPGLRLDQYSLRVSPDQAFINSAGAAIAARVRDMDEFAVSPKLGALYRLDNDISLFGQYAHGFRAPPYDTANFGFTNSVQRYQILPSFDLKPETSDGFEAGIRGRFADGSNFQISGFYNHYSDFIDTKVIGTTAAGLTQFQYRNLSSVDIYGVEARGEWQFARGWALRGSAAYARGIDKETGTAIDSVDPFRVVGGLAWSSGSGLGAEVNVTHALRHNQVSTGTYFRAPSYTVVDLAVHYDLGRNLSINAGLFNVTNEKYFLATDVVGVAANSATRDLYAQPGRYVAVNVVMRW